MTDNFNHSKSRKSIQAQMHKEHQKQANKQKTS